MKTVRALVAGALLASLILTVNGDNRVAHAVTSAALPVTSGYTAVAKSSSDGKCTAALEIPTLRSSSLSNVQIFSDGSFCVVATPNMVIPGSATSENPDIWVRPAGVTSFEYLVVAGGGVGDASSLASYAGGGGAAGEVVETRSPVSIEAHNKLKLFVGTGGTSTKSPTFSCISAVSFVSCLDPRLNAGVLVRALPGSAGNTTGTQTGTQGSGGGFGRANVGSTAPVAANGQYSGGNGFAGGGGGGGSGACGSGAPATVSGGGAGGAGCPSSITGTLAYYGVGGGGGSLCAGCVGGAAPNSGGIGGTSVTKVGSSPSSTSYGGGGGGSTNSSTRASGGNGVVIIRYANVSPPAWVDESITFAQCDRTNPVLDWVSAVGVPTPQIQVMSGSVLPPGLTAKSDGSGFSGVMSGPGRYDFTVQASNSVGTITKRFTGTIAACADVGIDSVIGPGTIAPGRPSTMTFVLANRAGPDTAPDATFTFRFPDNVTAVPIGFSCSQITALTCSVDVGAITRSSTPSSLADRRLAFTVTVASSFSANVTANGACSVSTTAIDGNLSNNTANCNFAVGAPSADLRVMSLPDAEEKTTYAPGEFGYRSFIVENLGPSDASNPDFFFDVDPSDIGPVSHLTGTGVWFTPSGSGAGTWSCSPITTPGTKKVLSCSSSSPMQKGSSVAIKVKMQASGNSSHGRSVVSKAWVQTLTNDPVASNNEVAAMLMVVDLRPDLNISGRFASTNVAPGASTTLTIRVANGGSVAANGPIVASLSLPSGLSVTPTSECSVASSQVTCTRNQSLVAPDGVSVPGGWVEFVLTVRVSPGSTAGSVMNLTASVPAATTSAAGANGGETNLWNNSATFSLTVATPQVDLVLSVQRPATTKAGSTADVRMTIENRGPSDAPNFSLRYDIPRAVRNIGSLPVECSILTSVIVCDASTTFTVGSTRSFTVTVEVDAVSLAGWTLLGSMEVSTNGAVDVEPANNKATIQEANLNVVVDPVVNTAVTTTTTSTTTTSIPQRALPNTGTRNSTQLLNAVLVLLLGVFFTAMSRGVRRRR